jgi:hypothetical protein
MPVTALYAALLTLLFIFLTVRVVGIRRAGHLDMGDGGNPLAQRLIRAHGNFAEYVPLGVVLLGLLELGGWSPWVLHPLGLILLAGRLAHAWSFSAVEVRMPSRAAGIILTLIMLGLSALLCLVQAFGFSAA